MESISKKQGLSDVQLLLGLVLIIVIMMIALPSFLSSDLSTEEEKTAASLRTVYAAQEKYYGMTATGYYGDFVDLSTTGKVLPQEWADYKVTKENYTFTLTRNDSHKKYCVLAHSSQTGEADLGINEKGTIFRAIRGQMICAEGEIGGTGIKTVETK